MKNLPSIYHFLLHTTVLQYTQSRIHRPKIGSFYLSALLVFAGSGTIIPDPGKISGSTTLY